MSPNASNQIPSLNGLVLAGGESTRMGMDKGLIRYHALPQREHLWHLLRPHTSETYMSCRPGQIHDDRFPLLEDAWTDLGPFGAILTAFDHAPDHAWLVVACDFPLLDETAITQLIRERDPSAIATSFWDAHARQPEPWISILEPTIFPILKEYLSRQRSSLRGILEDHGSHAIQPSNPQILLNANTPGEAEEIRVFLRSSDEHSPI